MHWSLWGDETRRHHTEIRSLSDPPPYFSGLGFLGNGVLSIASWDFVSPGQEKQMGGCCSVDVKIGAQRNVHDEEDDREYEGDEEDELRVEENGAIKRLRGSSWCTSMYTRQGRKGVNQDSMVVVENFMGEKNSFFCSVFDGHGPKGHEVARRIRELLPSKVSSSFRRSHSNQVDHEGNVRDEGHFFASWKKVLIESFNETDVELELEENIDSLCSGTTSVTIVKQGGYLLISNLGDSRAVLCSRDDKNNLHPLQLTADLKPNVQREAERIKDAGGRIFALPEEPHVFRLWMPEENCPGLAMTRAFGDFCLKDYGLLSVPEVSYRKIQADDEFVVLATDGIWDVLTNDEVIRIVASVKDRGLAAKVLVYYAVQAWRNRFPGSKVDDCAVVILFLKKRPLLIKSFSDMSQIGASNQKAGGTPKKSDGGDTVINCEISVDQAAKAPRHESLSRRRAARNAEDVNPQR